MPISTAGLADVFPYFPEWAKRHSVDAEGAVWVFDDDGAYPPYMVWHPRQGRMAESLALEICILRMENDPDFRSAVRRETEGYMWYSGLCTTVIEEPTNRIIPVDPAQCAMEFGQ
jgi:hypothetical protein